MFLPSVYAVYRFMASMESVIHEHMPSSHPESSKFQGSRVPMAYCTVYRESDESVEKEANQCFLSTDDKRLPQSWKQKAVAAQHHRTDTQEQAID